MAYQAVTKQHVAAAIGAIKASMDPRCAPGTVRSILERSVHWPIEIQLAIGNARRFWMELVLLFKEAAQQSARWERDIADMFLARVRIVEEHGPTKSATDALDRKQGTGDGVGERTASHRAKLIEQFSDDLEADIDDLERMEV